MAEAQVIPFPADERLGSERSDLVTQATEMTVVDQASADRAGALIGDIRALRKRVAETFDPIVTAAHQAHKTAVAKRTEHDSPLATAENLLKGRIGLWTEAEQRRRREAQAAAAAEQRRLDEEQRLAEAVALEAAGETEAAEQVLATPTPLPPPTVAAARPKVAGVSVRPIWNVEVTDLAALVAAIAAGEYATSFVTPALTAIKKHVDATAGERIPPGVRAWQTQGVAGRGR
jgi:hypothetical protein